MVRNRRLSPNRTHQGECTRGHGIPFGLTCPNAAKYGLPAGRGYLYYWSRCAHVEETFIVEIRNSNDEITFLDYVLDLPNGEVVVEGHSPDEESLARYWEILEEKLRKRERPILQQECDCWERAHVS